MASKGILVLGSDEEVIRLLLDACFFAELYVKKLMFDSFFRN